MDEKQRNRQASLSIYRLSFFPKFDRSIITTNINCQATVLTIIRCDDVIMKSSLVVRMML